MRKTLFTMLVAAMTAMTASAQALTDFINDAYAGKVVVTINGATTDPIDANVMIEKQATGDKINFVLKNFMLDDGVSEPMPIGNVQITDIPLTANMEKMLIEFSMKQDITIAEGDIPGMEGSWMGPMLDVVPVEISHGEVFESYMDIDIEIDMMASLGQIIHVDFYAGEKPTGIQNVMTSSQASTSAYNLAGQQINADAKGIIIKDGKKFIK